MPNTPETVVAMLATTSLGAIWSSCSPDFGHAAVLDRFGQIEPKVLIGCDGYVYDGKEFDVLQKLACIANDLDAVECVAVMPYLHIEAAEKSANGERIQCFESQLPQISHNRANTRKRFRRAARNALKVRGKDIDMVLVHLTY